MHFAGWHLAFRIVCPPCSTREFQIRFTIRISSEKKLGVIVSWVLNSSSKRNRSCSLIALVLTYPAFVSSGNCATSTRKKTRASGQCNLLFSPYFTGVLTIFWVHKNSAENVTPHRTPRNTTWIDNKKRIFFSGKGEWTRATLWYFSRPLTHSILSRILTLYLLVP